MGMDGGPGGMGSPGGGPWMGGGGPAGRGRGRGRGGGPGGPPFGRGGGGGRDFGGPGPGGMGGPMGRGEPIEHAVPANKCGLVIGRGTVSLVFVRQCVCLCAVCVSGWLEHSRQRWRECVWGCFSSTLVISFSFAEYQWNRSSLWGLKCTLPQIINFDTSKINNLVL